MTRQKGLTALSSAYNGEFFSGLDSTIGTFVVMSIKKRPFFLPQHLTSSFPAATVAFFIFIVSTLQQSSRPVSAGFPAETGAPISNDYNKKSPGLFRPGLDGCGAECNLFASGI